jgi:hypothetical protein
MICIFRGVFYIMNHYVLLNRNFIVHSSDRCFKSHSLLWDRCEIVDVRTILFILYHLLWISFFNIIENIYLNFFVSSANISNLNFHYKRVVNSKLSSTHLTKLIKSFNKIKSTTIIITSIYKIITIEYLG